jgi:hypothetical protein
VHGIKRQHHLGVYVAKERFQGFVPCSASVRGRATRSSSHDGCRDDSARRTVEHIRWGAKVDNHVHSKGGDQELERVSVQHARVHEARTSVSLARSHFRCQTSHHALEAFRVATNRKVPKVAPAIRGGDRRKASSQVPKTKAKRPCALAGGSPVSLQPTLRTGAKRHLQWR